MSRIIIVANRKQWEKIHSHISDTLTRTKCTNVSFREFGPHEAGQIQLQADGDDLEKMKIIHEGICEIFPDTILMMKDISFVQIGYSGPVSS